MSNAYAEVIDLIGNGTVDYHRIARAAGREENYLDAHFMVYVNEIKG